MFDCDRFQPMLLTIDGELGDVGGGGGAPAEPPPSPEPVTPPEPAVAAGPAEPAPEPSKSGVWDDLDKLSDQLDTVADTSEPSEPSQSDAVPEPVEPVQPEPDATPMDKALNEVYRSHPDLKPFLSQHPELKPMWFKASEMNKIFRTVEDAKIAQKAATEIYDFDRMYFSAKPEDTRAFIQRLWQSSLRDPDQKFDASTNPSSGAYERVAQTMVETAFGHAVRNIDALAPRAGWTAAQGKFVLSGIAKMLGLNVEGLDSGDSTELPPTAGTTASPQVDSAQAKFMRERAEFERERQLWNEQRDSDFQNSLQNNLISILGAEVDKVLKPAATALAKFPTRLQTAVRQDIIRDVVKSIDEDVAFQQQFEVALRTGDRSPEHSQKMLGMLEQRMRLYFPQVANTVLRDVGVAAINRQESRAERQQRAAAVREPVHTASPGRLDRGPSPSHPKFTGNYHKDAMAILESMTGGES